MYAQTKMELEETLFAAQNEDMDCLVEIESSIDGNANFHRFKSFDPYFRLLELYLDFYLFANILCILTQCSAKVCPSDSRKYNEITFSFF